MNRRAQAVVLFLVGGALLRAGVTGQYLRYVKAGLQPLVLAGGAVLVVAAAATVWYELRPRMKGESAPGHAHREPRISWLLVLPLLALILVAPPPLGSFAATRTGTVLQQPWGFPDLPAGDPLTLDVNDYAGRAVYDHGRSLTGRRVKLTGFVAFGPGGVPYLTRMVVSCCAADAQPVKVALAGQLPPVLQPDTWLEVVGTYTSRQTKDPVNKGIIPFIDVSQAKNISAPDEPYESWG